MNSIGSKSRLRGAISRHTVLSSTRTRPSARRRTRSWGYASLPPSRIPSPCRPSSPTVAARTPPSRPARPRLPRPRSARARLPTGSDQTLEASLWPPPCAPCARALTARRRRRRIARGARCRASPSPPRAGRPGPPPGFRGEAGLGRTPAAPAEVALIVPMRPFTVGGELPRSRARFHVGGRRPRGHGYRRGVACERRWRVDAPRVGVAVGTLDSRPRLSPRSHRTTGLDTPTDAALSLRACVRSHSCAWVEWNIGLLE